MKARMPGGPPSREGRRQPKQLNVLHIVSALDGGGVERMLMEYAPYAAAEGIQFHYAVHGPKTGRLESAASARGSIVVHLTPRRLSLWRHWRELWRLLRRSRFDVVHVHLNHSSTAALIAARLRRIPVRIVHAHGGYRPKGQIQNWWFQVSRRVIRLTATHAFACSLAAGEWLFGDGWDPDGSASYLMRNAFTLDPFMYNEGKRLEIRERERAGKDTILLSVGRLAPEKNHQFLVEVFARLPHRGEGYQMWIAGEGKLREDLAAQITAYKLSTRVRLLGHRTDISDLMQAADVLVMPSESEGLGLTVVEAQAASLPSLVSLGVPREVNFTGLVQFLPIEDPIQWVRALLSRQGHARRNEREALLDAGYSIEGAASEYIREMRCSTIGVR